MIDIPWLESNAELPADLKGVAEFADRLGVPWIASEVDGHPGPQWTGRQLVMCVDDSDLYFFHELMHWATASIEERAMFNYGLGRDDTFWFELSQTDVAGSLFEPVTDDTGRQMWKNSPTLPRQECGAIEAAAIDGFLLWPQLCNGDVSDGFSAWAEFGGDQNRTLDDYLESIVENLGPIVAALAEAYFGWDAVKQAEVVATAIADHESRLRDHFEYLAENAVLVLELDEENGEADED